MLAAAILSNRKRYLLSPMDSLPFESAIGSVSSAILAFVRSLRSLDAAVVAPNDLHLDHGRLDIQQKAQAHRGWPPRLPAAGLVRCCGIVASPHIVTAIEIAFGIGITGALLFRRIERDKKAGQVPARRRLRQRFIVERRIGGTGPNEVEAQLFDEP